jgi:hypothetical protein
MCGIALQMLSKAQSVIMPKIKTQMAPGEVLGHI